MRLEPLKNWVIARTAITRASHSIFLANQAQRVTRYALLEHVGPDAAAAGFKVGDFVVARTMGDMFFNAIGKLGSVHFVTFQTTDDNIVSKVYDLDPDELVCLDGTPFAMKVEIAA